MDLDKAHALPNQSTVSLLQKLSRPVLALSQGELSLRDFIFTYVHSELLQNRNISDLEQSIKFRTTRSGKLIEEMEMIKNASDEELKKHKDILEDAIEKAWEERRAELLSRQEYLNKALAKAESLKPPTEDFAGFFLYIKHHIQTALFRVEESIASDPKPQRIESLEEWKQMRLKGMKASLRENDRITVLDTESLMNTKEWIEALTKSLDEQLGPSLPILNEPKER